jgi:hypothetical protein
MPEHLFGHKRAFRLVQSLKLRRLLDLIEFGVCREVLIEDVKDDRLRDCGQMTLEDIQREGLIGMRRSWGKIGRHFEEGGEQYPDQNELKLKGVHAVVLTGSVEIARGLHTISSQIILPKPLVITLAKVPRHPPPQRPSPGSSPPPPNQTPENSTALCPSSIG